MVPAHRVHAVDPVRLGGDHQHPVVEQGLAVDRPGQLGAEELAEVAAGDAGRGEVGLVGVPAVPGVVPVVGGTDRSRPAGRRRGHHRRRAQGDDHDGQYRGENPSDAAAKICRQNHVPCLLPLVVTATG